MHSAWFDNIVAWIGAHPQAAGLLIFLIAFCDAVIVLGAIVPALPLMVAIGVLIGMGEIAGPYAVACAALGAFAGDGLSYWIGRRWGNALRGVWPFRRYPQLLDRGEALFRRNAVKSIFIARYVGAVRPFVPAIAGIHHADLVLTGPFEVFRDQEGGAARGVANDDGVGAHGNEVVDRVEQCFALGGTAARGVEVDDIGGQALGRDFEGGAGACRFLEK